MILNVGCGGRPGDKSTYFGDVRIDVKKFPAVTMLMDAHFLGFRDSVFDKIVGFEVLEHLESPINAIREFRRVLRDDGSVVLTVPNVWYWRRILKALRKRREVFNEAPTTDHKQAWDIYEFHSLINQAGFTIVGVKWLDWYPKGKRKLGILEPILRLIPQTCFTHCMFKLHKKRSE